MKNEYWLVPATLLNEIQKRGVTDSPLPHENVHWALSNDKKKAIVQGNFDDKLIAWLGKQKGVNKLGSYSREKAEKSVYDFMKTNKVEWQRQTRV